MKMIGDYMIKSFPSSRIATADIGQMGLKKHHIKALIELDVTEARLKIHEKKKLKENISFTSWLVKCISQAIKEYDQLNAVKKGKRKVVVFEDIDISLVVEREVQGEKVPLPYVIRKTNEKSISDIYNEIRDAQKQPVNNEGDYVLGAKWNAFIMKAYYAMPGFIRRLLWHYILRNPFLTKQIMGTVIITSIGMMGRINGWVIPVGVHPLEFAVGSIVKKPGVKDNKVEIREHLYMTVLVDHDVIDGALAARALSKLAEMIEAGYGL